MAYYDITVLCGMKLFIHALASRAVEVNILMNDYIPLFYVGVITYPYLNFDVGLASSVSNQGPKRTTTDFSARSRCLGHG